ncbi:MAG: hypothetical protein QOF12_2624 [Solirubrobacteraceae bacterium]|nr:hypothetical protein [Solirubrobacteraceae bacterium]
MPMVAVSPRSRATLAALAALLACPPAARAGWSAGHALRPAGGRTMQQLAIGTDGRTRALWSDAYEAATLWEAQAGPAAVHFGAARRLVTLARGDLFPVARTTSAGGAAVVFERRGGANTARVVARVQRPGGSFSAPVALSSLGQTARAPVLAMDAAGDALAAWRLKSGAVEIARRPHGTLRFGRRDRVRHGADARADFGAIAAAVGPGGVAALAFAARGGLYLATGSVRAGLGAPRRVGPAALPAAIGLATGPGGPLVAWTDVATCRVFPAGIALPATTASGIEPAPAVAIAAHGERVVACPGDGPLEVVTAPAGQPFASAPEPVGTQAASEPPSLATDPGGDVALAWLEQAPAGSSVAVALRPAGAGAFGAPQTLAPPRPQALGPLVALGIGGRAVTAWTDGRTRAAFNSG